MLTIYINRRKREAREVHKNSQYAQKVIGLKAKMLNKKRHSEKIQMKKTYVTPSRPLFFPFPPQLLH